MFAGVCGLPAVREPHSRPACFRLIQMMVIGMGYVWLLAAVWMGLSVLAATLSIRTGISVALLEIFIGAIAANTIGLAAAPWVDYLAGLGAIILAFLCGAEVQLDAVRDRAWANVSIGAGAFLSPFLAVFLFSYAAAGWTASQSLLAAIALSTTSVALVYTIISEAGQSKTDIGQIVLAARFINDIGTVFSLALITAQLNFRLAFFAAAMLAAAWSILKIAPFIMRNEPKGSEAGTRFLVFVLFLLGGLGSVSGTEAVVPAYLIGVVLAPLLQKEEAMAGRLKSAAFAWFTPFYFLRTGSLLDLTQWPAIAVMTGSLLAIKIASKCAAVVPLARMFNIGTRDAWSIAMLMSTGLTFGTVAAFLGLARNIIDAQQYAILVTAVIASGTIPALVAQRLLKPEQDYSCADRASGP